MMATSYSAIDTAELVQFALYRDSRTELEFELAQRLNEAMSMIEESRGRDDT